MSRDRNTNLKVMKYTTLTLDEFIPLIICVSFDVVEYALPILLLPVVGDMLDIIGLGLGMILFGWYGLLSMFEFIPFIDFFPFFIVTWVIWYYFKKRKERKNLEKFKEEWK